MHTEEFKQARRYFRSKKWDLAYRPSKKDKYIIRRDDRAEGESLCDPYLAGLYEEWIFLLKANIAHRTMLGHLMQCASMDYPKFGADLLAFCADGPEALDKKFFEHAFSLGRMATKKESWLLNDADVSGVSVRYLLDENNTFHILRGELSLCLNRLERERLAQSTPGSGVVVPKTVKRRL